MKNLFDLSGKVAIVTGASRGIGEGIAIELAKHGANVVVSDVLDGEAVVKKIKAMKRKAIFVKCDVSNSSSIKILMNEALKNFNKIDILVNNAGIFNGGSTENYSEADWDKTININLKGNFLLTKEAIKHMKKGSSIINISSVAGICGSAQGAAYCSSKGGIRLLTKSLAAEYGPKGIRVNSIHPGIIETAMTKGILKDKKTAQGMLSKIPLGRNGLPIDIAGPAVFLASNASSYVTGAELVADGGWISTL